MEFDLFKKIIDEIKNKVPAIRLSLRGEATLKKFCQLYCVCKRKWNKRSFNLNTWF